MLIDMSNGLQHLPLYTPNAHPDFNGYFLVGETIDATEQKYLQRLRLQLAQDGCVVSEFLAALQLPVLIIFCWMIEPLHKWHRHFR